MELNAGKVIGQKALLRAMYKIPYEVKRNKFFMAVGNSSPVFKIL